MKIAIGYPPSLSDKGTALLSQNRQFQYFHNPTFLFPVALGTGATMLREQGYDTIWLDAIAEEMDEKSFYKIIEEEGIDIFFFETKVPLIVVPSTFSFMTEDDLKDIGVNIVIYGNHLIRSAYPHMVKSAESVLTNKRCKEASDEYCMPIKEILTLVPEKY